MDKFSEISVKPTDTILFALKRMDKVMRKLLLVQSNGIFIGLISIGDIQRSILSKVNLNSPVSEILRVDVKVAYTTDNIEEIKQRMKVRRNEFMPLLTSDNRIVDVIFWEDVISEKSKVLPLKEKLPVVIMAGGMGSRLKPLTNVLPKPLIPISDKSIIEEIIQKFLDVGCNNFYISVNYKAEMIEHYINSVKSENTYISYLREDKPLGTIGSLFLLKGKIDSSFFVSNCDIVIDQDINEIYNYHKANKNTITVVSALKHYKIPYGTILTGENGLLIELSEKPEITFQINTGMYILEPELLNEIPENSFYHVTDLIKNVKDSGRRVGVFPVSEGSWKDIGEWGEYIKQINL
jgi:dTDP-glucose pyrophosphorylase